MRKAPHFFLCTSMYSRELKGTQGNWIYSREALVEVMEGKKLRKRGKEGKFHKSEEKKRENIEALYERLKMKNEKCKRRVKNGRK